MSSVINKIETVKAVEEMFSEVTTSDVELTNYKSVDFVITTGKEDKGEFTIKAYGKNGADGTAKAVQFYKKNGNTFEVVDVDGDKLTISGDTSVYRVHSADLARADLDRVHLVLSPVGTTHVSGCVLAISYEPRFTE